FIMPHKFFQAKYGQSLRELIAKGNHLGEVVHFGDQQVFAKGTTYTCLLFLDKGGNEHFHYLKVHDLGAWRANGEAIEGEIRAEKATRKEWNFVVGPGAALFERLNAMPVKLGDVAGKIFQGLVTSADPVYLLEPLGPEQGGYVRVKSQSTGIEYTLESGIVRPLCKGALDIRHYTTDPSKRVLFPYDVKASARQGKPVLIPEDTFLKQFPKVWRYLKEHYDILCDREKGKMRHPDWYGYVYPKSVSLFAKRKILTPSIALSASYALDTKGELYFVGSGGGGGGGYGIILQDDPQLAYEYVLGLLNSKALDFYLKQVSTPYAGGYYAYNRQYIEQLPIRTIDFSDPTDKTRHDRMVELVDSMLELHRDAREAKAAHDKKLIQRQIDATDKQIDQLVYEL
ncbi:Eco57I restriction-modification methylase domain-containing protein, partial [Candidatus Bipolaricaulota bacterium]|nr:Eco57I restriction-modification methylase domain-containing protein [Candidatus Bipolaricaulota bacterium]